MTRLQSTGIAFVRRFDVFDLARKLHRIPTKAPNVPVAGASPTADLCCSGRFSHAVSGAMAAGYVSLRK